MYMYIMCCHKNDIIIYIVTYMYYNYAQYTCTIYNVVTVIHYKYMYNVHVHVHVVYSSYNNIRLTKRGFS